MTESGIINYEKVERTRERKHWQQEHTKSKPVKKQVKIKAKIL